MDICEYTNEIDLADSSILPSCEIMVILTHDWPTVHEDPVWAAAWLSLLNQPTYCVPSSEQVLWLFEKTRYVNDILQTCEKNMMLPTKIVRARVYPTGTSDLVLHEIAEWAVENNAETNKFVTKENFSAGKEGVNFLNCKTVAMAEKKLFKLSEQVGKTNMKAADSRKRDGKGQGTFCCRRWCGGGESDKRKEKRRLEENSSLAYIDRVFQGGNDGVFMVQQYDPRFVSQFEKRLYFSNGVFLYSMGNSGWIDQNSAPRELENNEISMELKQSEKLLASLPQLKDYPLIRFDFGPGSRLSEIEVLPDLFGGPSGNLRGEKWNKIKHIVAESYVNQIVWRLTGLGQDPTLIETGNSKSTIV